MISLPSPPSSSHSDDEAIDYHKATEQSDSIKHPHEAFQELALTLANLTNTMIVHDGDERILHPVFDKKILLYVPLDHISCRDLKYLVQVMWRRGLTREQQNKYRKVVTMKNDISAEPERSKWSRPPCATCLT